MNVLNLGNSDGTWTIEVLLEPNEHFDYEDLAFDINPDELVELRNRVDSVPAISRHEQRHQRRKLYELTRLSSELPGGYR